MAIRRQGPVVALNPNSATAFAVGVDEDAGSEQNVLDHGDIVEAPGWFGPSERPLFGWFVYPRNLRVRGAVVLCQPIAEEGNMAYRTFRTLSQQLAREGFLALRFDYDGTGDSAGKFEDPARRVTWTESIVHAVAESRLWGATHVSLVGMRLGATLGYLAAAESALDLDDLILWDPCLTGKSFLRELQLLHRSWFGDQPGVPPGWIETPSYRFAPDFVADAGRIAIDGRVPSSDLARRRTVLFRADRTPSPKLRAALPQDENEWANISGQAELLNVGTLEAAVPVHGLAEVVSRLLRAAPEPTSAITARYRPTARWRENAQEVEETACFFGRDARLFGIRTSGAAPDPSRPHLLFLNVAAERHLGEGRTWLRLARDSASDGFISVRLDHSGVGDSATHPGHADDVLYDQAWLDDVPFVAEVLAAGTTPNLVGVGLCSSGASLLQSATQGGFREVIAVNVGFDLEPDDTISPGWTVFVGRPSWLNRLAVKHRRIAELVWSVSSIVYPKRSVLWRPREIVASGTEVTLMGGPHDMERIHHNPLWRGIWGRPLSASGRFRQQTLPNADHSLRTGSGQDEVIRAVLDRLRTYVPPVPEVLDERDTDEWYGRSQSARPVNPVAAASPRDTLMEAAKGTPA
jgi:alpha-beta hydrolase superfamily lysophospholipase